MTVGTRVGEDPNLKKNKYPWTKPAIIKEQNGGRGVVGGRTVISRHGFTKTNPPSIHFCSIFCGMRGFLLLLLYLIGTKATKYKANFKSKLEEIDASYRGPAQVLHAALLEFLYKQFTSSIAGRNAPLTLKSLNWRHP